jgi:hypothetical protein
MKSVSGKDSSFVYMYVNELVLTFVKELSEKSVSSAVGHKSLDTTEKRVIKFDVDCIINALKNMEDTVELGLSDKFVVLSDPEVKHLIPFVQ